VLLGGKRSDEMNSSVSFQKVDCLTRSVSRSIALLKDKELATDLVMSPASPSLLATDVSNAVFLLQKL